MELVESVDVTPSPGSKVRVACLVSRLKGVVNRGTVEEGPRGPVCTLGQGRFPEGQLSLCGSRNVRVIKNQVP